MMNLAVLKNYNSAKTKKLSLASPMPMSHGFQWCKPDGKEASITTKLVLYIVWTKPHKTELGGIALF